MPLNNHRPSGLWYIRLSQFWFSSGCTGRRRPLLAHPKYNVCLHCRFKGIISEDKPRRLHARTVFSSHIEIVVGHRFVDSSNGSFQLLWQTWGLGWLFNLHPGTHTHREKEKDTDHFCWQCFFCFFFNSTTAWLPPTELLPLTQRQTVRWNYVIAAAAASQHNTVWGFSLIWFH